MKKKKLFIGLGILSIFLIFTVVAIINSDKLSVSATKVTLTVNTQEAKATEIVSDITVKGSLKPIEHEKIYSSTLAQVDHLSVEPGVQVNKDDVLLTFSDAEYKQLLSQLDQAEKNIQIQDEVLTNSTQQNTENINQAKQLVSQLEVAKEQSQRNLNSAMNDCANNLKLFYTGAISQDQLNASQDAVKALEEKLQLDITAWNNAKVSYNHLVTTNQTSTEIQRDIQNLQAEDIASRISDYNLEIISPISGTVLAVNVEEGAIANQAMPVIEVGDLSNFIVEGYVTEFDAPSLKIGQNVTIKTRTLNPIEYHGTVTYIAPLAGIDVNSNSSTKSVKVEVTLTDYDANGGILKPGYTVDTTITLATKDDAVVVPILSTLKDKEGNYYVYIVNDSNMVEKRIIKYGILSDLFVEVYGVEEGEQVIINPSSQIKDGIEVNPILKDEGNESND